MKRIDNAAFKAALADIKADARVNKNVVFNANKADKAKVADLLNQWPFDVVLV